MKSFKTFILIIVAFPFVSCENDINNNSIFFGGQIINPSSNYLILHKNNSTVDCLLLDSNNSFKKTFNNLDSGVYKIEHIPEYQTVFLEPGDSLWVRVNAADFKQSIVFSGKGSSKNNFLMDMEISQENENEFLSSKYSLESDLFSLIIDSLVNLKKKQWKQMDSINILSPFAQKVTMASYVYPYGTLRERYALLRGTNWSSSKNKTYFKYRKFFNFEETDLSSFDPYIDYVLNFLNKKSLDSSNNYFLKKQKTDFNIKRLKILENIIIGRKLKNNLARAIAYDEILNFDNHSEHDNFLQYFFAVNSNTKFLGEVLSLHNDIKKMNKGSILPEIFLQSSKFDTITSSTFFNKKPTVLYFWSQSQMNHYKKTLKIIEKFRIEKPQYRYIGICIQPLNTMALQVNQMLGLNIEDQYAIIDFENASKKWIITLLNKAIIIDLNGKISNGFANIFNTNFLNDL